MKRLKYIMMVALVAMLMASCTKDEQVRVNPEMIKASSLIDLPTEPMVLNKDEAELLCDTIHWSKAEFGYEAAIDYTLQIRKKGSEEFTTLGSSSGIPNWSAKNGFLNNALIKIRCEAGVENLVEVMVTASIAASYTSVNSEIATISIVPFDSAVEHPSLWVIGAYCGWSFDNAHKLYSIADNGVYTGWIDMNDASGFKFTTVPDWNGTAYGGSMDALDIDPGAGNIALTESGYFCFEVNTRTLVAKVKYEIESLGIIGDAAPNGWDAQANLSYDAAATLWRGTFSMHDGGKFKVRINDDWGISFGEGEEEGLLGQGSDISFNLPSGVYDMEIDFSRAIPTYKFTAKN